MEQSKQTASTGRAEPKLLRKLGNNENYQLAMYLLDQYRGTSVSCRYSIPTKLSGSGSESRNKLVQAVENAIIHVVLKNTVLQVAIADAEARSPSWVQLESLNLRQHVTWHFKESDLDASFDKDLQDLLADEVDATYPELDRVPGWRVVLIHFQQANALEIVFTYNHPHCDGISGKVFHSYLLQALNSAVKYADIDDDRSTIKLPESAPELPPPVEDICKLPLTVPFVLKTAWKEYGLTTFRPTIARWAPIPPRSSPFKTQVRAFDVEAAPLEKILSACRQHKTTLTGLLHALTLTSIASQLSEEAAPAFASGTTVDMRRWIDPKDPGWTYWSEPKRTMGNFVTVMSHEFERGIISQFRSLLPRRTKAGKAPENPQADAVVLSPELTDLIWSTAARVRRELEDRVETGLKNDMVGMMRFVGDWQQEMSRAAHRPREFSWWVTGIGVLDPALSKSGPGGGDSAPPPTAPGDDEDAWAIRRAQFVLSTETTAAAINISPMTAAGERLCVGASWQDCLFDASMGERVMADLEAWLGQLA